ncbi:MAG: inositol monophosphatase family protein [Ornithinimicrobium sp.]|uniref:inositol monophosphatase family protein n=1 Tax=Ornithinimicrobium sp. TaxID=1977084 RepID=UPI0017EACA5A|nr:inositol monophosphatase [Actinomycetota bacterium]
MDTAAVLDLLRDVAQRVINPRFRDLSDEQVMEKNPGDLVTVADHEAETLITEALSTAYPDAVILGEEAQAADPALLERYDAAEHAFTVDPVDGTKNFVHGSRDHAVMVAEVRDGRTVRGWIWQPQHQAGYVAELGQGVRRDGVLLQRAAPPRDPGELDVRTSHRPFVGAEPGPLRPLELTWVCCGVDYPHLLQGDADATIYTRTKPWDHAPGALMVTEAGGFVGTFDGTPYVPQGSSRGIVVAADRPTYDVVQRAVAEL